MAAADPYAVLAVSPGASAAEIKAAYRALVKQHHPDAGGDATTIIALNAAWEILRDRARRTAYDRSPAAAAPSQRVSSPPSVTAEQQALAHWFNQVYGPIDRLLAQVINPFPAQLKELAADPYDDQLMEAFCSYLEQSQQKINRVEALYAASAAPLAAKDFSLQLYHCFAQLKDALMELERYTMGYVDSYLHDGREMIREAKRFRASLQQERSRFGVSKAK
ncbi:J domain-containing protein [Cyanobium sp. WAJ14-Wanaka]|nr:J domain-containing protein [Cyanobium sp. WAJ14-Wanaka]MCP9775309.1 J domain-containing protein [Cyanobium sp. WAJ14-Wanaka]